MKFPVELGSNYIYMFSPHSKTSVSFYDISLAPASCPHWIPVVTAPGEFIASCQGGMHPAVRDRPHEWERLRQKDTLFP